MGGREQEGCERDASEIDARRSRAVASKDRVGPVPVPKLPNRQEQFQIRRSAGCSFYRLKLRSPSSILLLRLASPDFHGDLAASRFSTLGLLDPWIPIQYQARQFFLVSG